MEHLYRYFASTGPYGSGAYGSATYAGSTTSSTGSSAGTGNTSTGAANSSGSLSNTGFDIVAAITVACVIIFVALIIRFWKRPKRTKTDNQDKSDS